MTLSIKEAILSPALRAVGQQTEFRQASDLDYRDAFRFYQQMLEFWTNEQGIILYFTIPVDMNEAVGTGDPVQALKQNLILYIADHYYYDPTPAQKSNAARSLRALRSRANTPYMNRPKNQPRGSGNTWRRGYYNDCDSGSKNYVTNTGVKVITNE